MKTYIVYLNGVEIGYIKARNHNHAEQKAWAFALASRASLAPMSISVAYTEL